MRKIHCRQKVQIGYRRAELCEAQTSTANHANHAKKFMTALVAPESDLSRRSSGGDGCRRKNAQKAQRLLYLINREPHEINEQLLKKEFSSVSVLVSCWLFATTIRVSEQQNLGHPSCGGLGKPILRFSRLKFSVFSAVKKFLSVA